MTVQMSPGYENLDTFVDRVNSYDPGAPNAQGLMRVYLPAGTINHPTLNPTYSTNIQLGWNASTALTGGTNPISCYTSNSKNYCTVYFAQTGTTVPAVYGNPGNNSNPLVCFKFEGAQSAYDFNDKSNSTEDGPAGTNIGFDNVTWHDAGGGDFRNIDKAYVTNSQILARNPVTDCFTHPGGGPQFNRPGDISLGLDMGVLVSNFTAINTGDDTIAIYGYANGSRKVLALLDPLLPIRPYLVPSPAMLISMKVAVSKSMSTALTVPILTTTTSPTASVPTSRPEPAVLAQTSRHTTAPVSQILPLTPVLTPTTTPLVTPAAGRRLRYKLHSPQQTAMPALAAGMAVFIPEENVFLSSVICRLGAYCLFAQGSPSALCCVIRHFHPELRRPSVPQLPLQSDAPAVLLHQLLRHP